MAEDPTRSQHPPSDPYEDRRETVYEEEAEPGLSRQEVADQARSSRNWAYAAAFLAILAAGLGAIAIIFATGDEEGGGRQGASRSSVSELRNDVESLQERVDELAQQTESTEQLSNQLDELESTVNELSSAQGDLPDELSALEERVGQLESSANAGGGSGGGGGTGGGVNGGSAP